MEDEMNGMDDINLAGLTDDELMGIEKEIEDTKRKLEKEKVEQFKEKVKSNSLLKENNLKLVNGNAHLFFKVLSVIFLLVLVSVVVFFGYLGYNGYFKSEIMQDVRISPLFNASIKNTVNNEFNTSIENQYGFYPNYTIINNVFCPE